MIGPSRRRRIEVISVPDDSIAAVAVISKPGANQAVGIIEVGHPAIVQDLPVDEVSAVGGQHVEPDHVDADA